MTLRILAIDPGPVQSGVCVYERESRKIEECGIYANAYLRLRMAGLLMQGEYEADVMVAEYMRPRGMPTAQAEMDAMFELGRIRQCWTGEFVPLSRSQVKMAICGKVTATDSNIRRALIDLWGGDAAIKRAVKCKKCKGTGKVRIRQLPPLVPLTLSNLTMCPTCNGSGITSPAGPLAGVANDGWSALALAVTYAEGKV